MISFPHLQNNSCLCGSSLCNRFTTRMFFKFLGGLMIKKMAADEENYKKKKVNVKDTKWCTKFTELCGEMCVRTDNKHLYNCFWCDSAKTHILPEQKGANISNDGYPIIISESNVLQDIIQHHEVLCDERGPHSVQGSRAEVGLTPSPESFLFCFVKLNFFFF